MRSEYAFGCSLARGVMRNMDAVSPRSKPAFEEKRLYSLDALRGLAAIGVAVFWHCIHFFPACLFCDRHAFPFYRTFQWFYDYGQLLVDFSSSYPASSLCALMQQKSRRDE
jgi:hypothetical protein